MFGRDLTTGAIPALSWSLAWPVIVAANVATCTGAYLLLRRTVGRLLRETKINGALAMAAAQGADQWR